MLKHLFSLKTYVSYEQSRKTNQSCNIFRISVAEFEIPINLCRNLPRRQKGKKIFGTNVIGFSKRLTTYLSFLQIKRKNS